MIRALWADDVPVTMGPLEWATFPPERMNVDDAGIGLLRPAHKLTTLNRQPRSRVKYVVILRQPSLYARHG
jgi:hypothetical protein